MATGIIVALNPVAQFQKTRDAQRKSDLSQIQKAIEIYYQDNGRYPENNNALFIKRLDGTPITVGNPYWQPYMAKVPIKDPSVGRYLYCSSNSSIGACSSSDGQSYYIYTYLERTGDSQMCNSGNDCISIGLNGIPANSCAGHPCNYGVSSPNVSPWKIL